jgi:hypothetical protein
VSAGTWLWLVAVLVTAGGVALAAIAQWRHRPVLALPALLPAVAGAIMYAGDLTRHPPARAWVVILSAAVAALGVIAGSPITTWVLQRTEPPSTTGPTGGILVRGRADGETEILRGGTTIGYLERFAVIGAAAVGRLEIVAAVIAIKGLGRFTELSSAVARERFIIGTLVSLLWAGICGALIWPYWR